MNCKGSFHENRKYTSFGSETLTIAAYRRQVRGEQEAFRSRETEACASDVKFTYNEHGKSSTGRSTARKSKDEEIQANTEAADPQGEVRPKGGGKKEKKRKKGLLPFNRDMNQVSRVAGYSVTRLNTRA